MKQNFIRLLFPERAALNSTFVSESAKYDQLDDYLWYVYKGKTKVNIAIRTHKRTISDGMIFGIRQTRNGTHYVILPEMYHVDFVVERSTANKLINNGEYIKKPKISNLSDPNSGKIIRRLASEIAIEKSENRKWDSARFKAAREVKNESVAGVNFSNYQWRKITVPEGFKLSKADKKVHYVRNAVVGMRFIKPATGGIIIDQDFNRFALSTETYDRIVAGSVVLPKSKWPEGEFTKADADNAREEEKLAEKARRAAERRRLRELEAAEKREAELEERKKRAEARREQKRKEQEAKEAAITLTEHMEKVRKSRTIPMDDKEILKRVRKDRKLKAEDLGLRQEHLDDSDDLDLDLTNLGVKSPEKVDAKPVKPKPVIEMLEQVISDARKDLPVFKMDDIEADDLSDVADDELEDSEIDHDLFEEEETPKVVKGKPAAKEKVVEEDDSLDDDSLEDDKDVEIAEDELEESDTEDDLEEEEVPEVKFEEADVIVFRQDATEQREFAIVGIDPMKGNDHILIYKLYDIDNEPDDYRTVRIDTHKKRRIEDMAELKRKLTPKDFLKYQAMSEDLMKNPEAIES